MMEVPNSRRRCFSLRFLILCTARRGFLLRSVGLLITGLSLCGCLEEEPEHPAFLLGVAGVRDENSLKATKTVGAESFRYDIPWRLVEARKGMLTLPSDSSSLARRGLMDGLVPLPILGYGNPHHGDADYPVSEIERRAFVNYAQFVAASLPSKVSLLEVWNEWNLAIGMPADTAPGRAEDYVRLLADVYRELKPRYPDRIFIGGSMAGIGRTNGWTERALRAGMLDHLDGLSFHPYVYWMNRRNRVPERGMLGLVEELEQLLAQYPKGAEVPLYVTEIGWPTHDAREGVTLRQQADYISRALLLLRANPRVSGVWVHTLKDRPGEAGDMEAHFGLLFPDGSPKPAWFSFRDTARLLKRIVECRRIDFGVDADEIAGVELVDAAGKHHLAVWTIDEDSPWIVELACRVTPIRKVLSRSVIGSGVGPPIALSREPDGESLGSITVGSSPTVIRDVGKHWRILRSFSSSN